MSVYNPIRSPPPPVFLLIIWEFHILHFDQTYFQVFLDLHLTLVCCLPCVRGQTPSSKPLRKA